VAADPEVKSKTLIFIWLLTFTPVKRQRRGRMDERRNSRATFSICPAGVHLCGTGNLHQQAR